MCWVMPPASPLDHVRLPDRVEQLGLAVVDVTHDGHDRRPGDQPVVVDVLVEVDVEPREQLAVLFLRADDLHVEAEVLAEQQQRLVGARLGRRDHLAQVEHLLDQRARVGVDLSAKSDSEAPRGSRTTWPCTTRGTRTHRRRGQVVELLPLLLLRLATLGLAAADDRRHHRHRRHDHDRPDRHRDDQRRPAPAPGAAAATGTAAVATAAATGTAAARTAAVSAAATAGPPPPGPPRKPPPAPPGHRTAAGSHRRPDRPDDRRRRDRRGTAGTTRTAGATGSPGRAGTPGRPDAGSASAPGSAAAASTPGWAGGMPAGLAPARGRHRTGREPPVA